jgi:pyrroline-5-carboxylate reductase
MPEIKLLLVGCGKMGSSILRRALLANFIRDAVVVEPMPAPDFAQQNKQILWVDGVAKIPADFMPDIVLFAVKPQSMAEVIPLYAHYNQALFLSIAAGVTLARLQTYLQNSGGSGIVRVMPNLPASIGEGISVAAANAKVSSTERSQCDQLLSGVGDVIWLDDEKLLDAVTAVSGSGPAYVFALCEAMTNAGIKLGLTPELSAQLARKTLIGSGALLDQSTESAESLRHAVTSKGGTTEAALNVLFQKDAFQKLTDEALAAAASRARELAR